MLYKKPQLRNIKVKNENNYYKTNLLHGSFGIRTLESGWLTSEQIETIRRSLRRVLKSRDKIWLRLKPNKILTGKSRGIRMGKGKGLLKHTVFQTKAGRVIFEFEMRLKNFSWLKSINSKSPIKLDIIKKYS